MKLTLKRLLPLCLALVLLCQVLLFSACDKKPATGDPVPYTVTVRTEGGMALADVEIFVYADSTKVDLVGAGKTNTDGIVTFEAVESDSYVATLTGVPEGYTVEEIYPLTSRETVISLPAEMKTDVDMSTVTVGLGDVMFDFSVTDTEDVTYTLSDLLKEKQAVVLNFWYTNCGPCKMEFPYLQQAYEKYNEQIEVLAMNPIDTDKATIAAFKEDLELTFPLAAVEADWERIFGIQGYPTTVVIDRFSNVSLIHTGMIETAEAFEEIFSHYADENYTQGVIEDVADLTPSATGEKLEFGGVQTFEVTVPADTQIPVDLYKVMNVILEIKSENVYVVYGGETYTPENGVLTLPISAPDTMSSVSLMIGNSGTKEETFTANLSMPKGSMGNPYAMSLGEFDTSVEAGNSQGVFFTYTAEKTGVLTVKCLSATAGVQYGYNLYNLNSYAYRTLESEGSKDTDGKPILAITVTKGDAIQFSAASMPDEKNEYPAASFTFLAAFEEKDVVVNTEKKNTTYSVTVKDDSGKAVPGATLTMLGGDGQKMATDKNGVATAELANGTYYFVLTVPKGHTASVTTVKLTADKPSASLTLAKKVVKDITYTVIVKDPAGKPVPGATVAIGNLFGTTDANGKLSLVLVSDDYQAYIVPPSGYVTPDPVKLTATGSSVTITLTAASNDSNGGNGDGSGQPEATDKTYTVSVTDAAGKAQSGVMVRFLDSTGKMAAMASTNASGAASATLKAGKYTAELMFSGSALGYDKKAAALTADKTAVTVIVAEGITGEPVSLYDGTIIAEAVRLGGTYVELLPNATKDNPNYFSFTPTETGVYRFTTSNPSAVITNWGGNPQYIYNATQYTAEGSNTIEVTIKDLGEGYHQFLGIHGAAECVVLVTRVGDVVLGWEDKPYDTYQTTATLKKFTKPAGTASYVDITKKHSAVLGSDGYYHLDSASGPILYVNLGESAPYASIADAAEAGSMKDYIHDANGEVVKKIEFNSCIYQYYGYTNNETNQWVEGYTDDGFYPLTADLMYILQTHTECYGWNDASSQNYLFTGKTINADTAWMFCVCTIG